VRFSVAVEQLRSPANRVTVDPRYVDPLGNPRPVISYHLDDYTLAGMAAATDVYRRLFRQAGIEDRTDYGDGTGTEGGPWFPSASYDGQVFRYHGMGHFAGTHVMGSSAADSVVDADQRSWSHQNLFVVGSGSFPTMGTSNPTLTMAALSLRSAERMIEELI
jgi:choline dehydrogenase-like flavoprotein